MVRIGIAGALGRMGQAIAAALAERTDAELAGGCDKPGSPGLMSLAGLAEASDVLIDFTAPAALAATLAAGKPVVIGTTGLEAAHHAAISAAARHIPVLQSANMSLGVNLLAALVRQAAARLGPDWDIEVLEMHHRHKVDAPSGTALLLGEAAAAGRGVKLPEVWVKSRDGITGARPEGAIGFATLRGGSVPGDHTVMFAAQDERLELTHIAQNRGIFARGAIAAAVWLAAQPPGRYSMADVLGL